MTIKKKPEARKIPVKFGERKGLVSSKDIKWLWGAPAEAIDPIYYTDDYPRIGCIIGIDVQAEGYSLCVTAPGGKRIETYALVKTLDDTFRMITEWCEGKVPSPTKRESQKSWIDPEKEHTANVNYIKKTLTTIP